MEAAEVWRYAAAVRESAPLTHCITNAVSMDAVANVLLAAGASPLMTACLPELEDISAIESALYINIGTLLPETLVAMKMAAEYANARSTPWVLDPVGAGASAYRTQACLELMNMGPAVIRGNASEILALAGAAGATTKGVDAAHQARELTVQVEDAVESAKALASGRGCVVAVSGAVDVVTDGTVTLRVANGHPLLTRITAMGCSVTALITAFCSVPPHSPLHATATALAVFGLAAEIAGKQAKGPGTLRAGLMDALHNLDEATVLNGVHVTSS
eukprot:jgi/Chlat1/2673/Chrsp18S02990